MSTDITHLTGYTVTVPTPVRTLTRLDAYALFELFPETRVTSLTGYYLLEPKNRIPLHKEDKSAITDMIKRVSTRDWGDDELVISEPTVVTGQPRVNTLITVNEPTGRYLGTFDLSYTRRDIAESFVDITVTRKSTVYELIDELSEVTGLVLSARDFVDGPIGLQDDTVVLEAADTSYFFIPGTQVTVTLLE